MSFSCGDPGMVFALIPANIAYCFVERVHLRPAWADRSPPRKGAGPESRANFNALRSEDLCACKRPRRVLGERHLAFQGGCDWGTAGTCPTDEVIEVTCVELMFLCGVS